MSNAFTLEIYQNKYRRKHISIEITFYHSTELINEVNMFLKIPSNCDLGRRYKQKQIKRQLWWYKLNIFEVI